MKMHKLTSQPRTVLGKKVKTYRRKGLLPAVLYGARVNMPLFVSEREFCDVYRMAGESSLISLLGQDAQARNVIIHDVSRNPVTEKIMHVDFYEVRMDKKMRAKVQLAFVGESPAVKSEGGILVHPIQEIEVECLPQNLPHEISVDISELIAFTDVVRAKDLKLPQGVTLHNTEPDTMVALVEEPRSEAEMEDLAKVVDEKTAIAEVKVVGEEERKKKEAEKNAEEPS